MTKLLWNIFSELSEFRGLTQIQLLSTSNCFVHFLHETGRGRRVQNVLKVFNAFSSLKKPWLFFARICRLFEQLSW